jgi:hypothetical protein
MASVNGSDQFSFDFLPGSFQLSDLHFASNSNHWRLADRGDYIIDVGINYGREIDRRVRIFLLSFFFKFEI